SFEDEQVAALLNERYVAIKVDREERPDLDEIYMTAVQLMTGQGGWPMSVFLMPDRRPFFGGTYFPKDDRYGRPGFIRVLTSLSETWKNDPKQMTEGAEKLTEALRENARRDYAAAGELPTFDELLRQGANELRSQLDPKWGGFGSAPKFPRSMGIELLLRAFARFGDARHLEAATLTLDHMAMGGMYDHVGGGFHRYSVDDEWLVPHFEKMLYDNASLAALYVQGWQATGKAFYRRVARETLDYVMRDMTDERTGAFYSTLDADSEGHEGKFYVWQVEEIKAALGGRDGKEFCERYDITTRGNFEGTNIPHLSKPLEDELDVAGIAAVRANLDTLFHERLKRVHPLRDDKVLTSWNALMVSALAQAGLAFDEPRYREAAVRAMEFLTTTMMEGGRVLHAYRGGKAHIDGYLEDYAYLLAAALDTWEASFDPKWLERAREIAGAMMERFADPDGGFFNTAGNDPALITRMKEVFEGATPSPNGVAAYALARLAKYTNEPRYREAAEGSLRSFGLALGRAPAVVGNLVFAYAQLAGGPKEIALVGSDAQTTPLLDEVCSRYLPGRALARFDPANGDAPALPLLKGKDLVDGKAAAYVCENYGCKKPVTEPSELAALLEAAPAR
ncbi:MAG: thioredoxin domain-containing protein, partial [Chrysiogenetes bacterium]|nr:thioredoxin domain-containing protein [Chrysiogenetes bacterium]